MTDCKHYIVGASLGHGMQPTAVAVVEQTVWKTEDWRPVTEGLKLRHLERVPLEAGYPETVKQIAELVKRPEIADEEGGGGVDVILDITATGRVVVELFEGAGIKPITIRITGAATEEEETDPGAWRIPKVELVGNLLSLYQSDRMKIAKTLELTPALVDELEQFKMRPPRIDPNDPESWREGQSDDLVFAVAVAAWRGNRHVPMPQVIRDRVNHLIEEHSKEMARSII